MTTEQFKSCTDGRLIRFPHNPTHTKIRDGEYIITVFAFNKHRDHAKQLQKTLRIAHGSSVLYRQITISVVA